MRTPSIVAFAVLLAGCASPPVWRTAKATDPPLPTLAAAGIYDFSLIEHREEVTVDASGGDMQLDFKALAKGVGDYIKDNPDQVANAAFAMAEANKVLTEGKKAVAMAAPAMHDSALACLRAQGFAIEVDGARSQQLAATTAGDFAYVAPDTAARPFDTFPMFGPGSKSWVVERLRTARPREAFASIHAEFQAEGNQVGNPVNCRLRIAILDREGVQVFGGDTVGVSQALDSRSETMRKAFAVALEQMAKPEILK